VTARFVAMRAIGTRADVAPVYRCLADAVPTLPDVIAALQAY